MDLRRLQELVSEDWRGREPPRQRHIGDVAWGWHTGDPEGRQVKLWDGAWAWLEEGTAEIQVHPDLLGSDLHHEVLSWAEAHGPVSVHALETDVATLAVLEGRGYRQVPPTYPFVHLARRLEGLPEPSVPAGYRLRTVGEGDVDRRVEVHRAAWHPSRFTAEKYERVMASYPYRADLDWVAELPDGSFAANVLCWLDEENGVAELEPVGTHPAHRRHGLASAASIAALRRAHELGARFGIVYARADEAYPVPKSLYESIGFRPRARMLQLEKAHPA